MDIHSKGGCPASDLSNFAAHPFEVEGVPCASMEGFLQSLKFDKPHIQRHVCALVGLAAKLRGRARDKRWRQTQTLWWDGESYDRHGREYQELLDRAYTALARNEGFRRALLATGDAVLTHSIGSKKRSETVLTESEFCSRLMQIRDVLRARGT